MGDLDEQLAELAAAGDGGTAFDLGYHYFHDHDDPATAERFYRVAIGAGEIHAFNNLGRILGDQGRDDEAETLYRQGVEAGDTKAAANLARFLAMRDRRDEAVAVARPAAEAGDADAQEWLARTHFAREDWAESERWFRAAAEHDVAEAITCVGVLREMDGDVDEAERWLRRGLDLGDPHAAYHLGLIARRIREDPAESARLLRIAVDAYPDDASFRHQLAVSLADLGRDGEAAAEYERAAGDGHARSAVAYGWMLEERDDADAAEPWFRQAMAAGDMIGQTCVALLELDRGNADEAERLFREAAADEPHARFNLGLMRGDAGDTEEADRLIRQAADEGSTSAQAWLHDNG
jgi:TPR repeat protein